MIDPDYPIADAAKVYRAAFIAGVLPDPDLTISAWADAHRMLSQKSSAEPGPWRTERTPYLREIMDCLSSNSPVKKVVFVAGTQVGKTECGNNFTGAIIDIMPGPMMIVQPTVELAKRMSKQRIAPMIEETPRLKGKIADARSRDSGNTMQVKEFAGGMMILTGANSAVGLRSMPVKYLFLDEVDAYPEDADDEGDPVNLALRRTTTFARRKIYMCSTPLIKDTSRIEREYLLSDQRRYYVTCPHCKNKDWMRWENIKWENSDPSTAMLLCKGCGVYIEERHKTWMMAQENGAEWRATSEGNRLTAGFHLSSLYSPIGWKSWAEIVEDFLLAKSDAPLLKEWTNTQLAETWEDSFAAKVGADALRARTEIYEPMVCPPGVLCITVGVDVQDNRLVVVMRGWGRDEESWLLYYVVIYGDPAQDEVWKQLDEILLKPVAHTIAAAIPIMAVCVDSGGHFTHEVYNYCRQRRSSHVLAVKGVSTKNKPAIARPTKVDLNYKQKVIKRGAEVWPVGPDTIKSVIYARLKYNSPGKGYYHFYNTISDEYFEELTAEKQITRYVKGFPIREWVKKSSARNEVLDCEVYAYAALQSLYMRMNRKTIWDQLEKRLVLTAPLPEKKVDDSSHEMPAPAGEEKAPLPAKKAPVKLRRAKPNFATRF